MDRPWLSPLDLNICFIIVDILQTVFFAIDGSSNRPSSFKNLSSCFLGINCIIVKPSSMRLRFPVLFELKPSVSLSVVLYLISFSKQFTPYNWGLFETIAYFDMSSIQPSHLMPIHALMMLMFVLKTANSATARAFFSTNNNSDHIKVGKFVFFS